MIALYDRRGAKIAEVKFTPGREVIGAACGPDLNRSILNALKSIDSAVVSVVVRYNFSNTDFIINGKDANHGF